MGVTRRTFVAGAAALCIGCRSDGDGALPGDPEAAGGGAIDREVVDEAGTGGFGETVDIGSVNDLVASLEAGEGFHYVPEARAWVVRYPPEALAGAEAVYGEHAIAAGFVALYQKCTHLGCRVPECVSSGRFECPCHGSIFNRVGEWVGGPAPRGLDRFVVTIVDDRVHVDTAVPVEGPARGISTIDGEPTGPSCLQF